jgi:competence protein ComEC
VGQGLAAVVRTQGGTLVYDTGPSFGSGFDTGASVVAPFLKTSGVERVDTLILSHADRDHAGGAAGLLGQLPVGRILSGEPDSLDLPGVLPCTAGQGWDWSGVSFRILHPGDGGELGNDASCVLRVETGGRAILLPGDLGRQAERRLAERVDGGLKSDILVAGHHGSATSTGAELLAATAPSLVLYSAGYGNPFGFPAEEVRGRVAALGVRTFDTGLDGAVELSLSADGAIDGPWTRRGRSGRLWTHRPLDRGQGAGP